MRKRYTIAQAGTMELNRSAQVSSDGRYVGVYCSETHCGPLEDKLRESEIHAGNSVSFETTVVPPPDTPNMTFIWDCVEKKCAYVIHTSPGGEMKNLGMVFHENSVAILIEGKAGEGQEKSIFLDIRRDLRAESAESPNLVHYIKSPVESIEDLAFRFAGDFYFYRDQDKGGLCIFKMSSPGRGFVCDAPPGDEFIIAPNGRVVLAIGESKLHLWDLRGTDGDVIGGGEIGTFREGKRRAVMFSPQGDKFAVIGLAPEPNPDGEEDALALFTLRDGGKNPQYILLPNITIPPSAKSTDGLDFFSADGTLMLLCNLKDGNFGVYDTVTKVDKTTANYSTVVKARFSPSGHLMAAICENDTVVLLNLDNDTIKSQPLPDDALNRGLDARSFNLVFDSDSKLRIQVPFA